MFSSSTPASRARSASRSQQPATTCAGANGSGVISKLSVSIFDMSRMPLTTDKQMMAGIVDQAGIFVAALGIEHQRRLLHQHLGEADDGVERRAQFVAHGGEEAALGGVGAFGLGMRASIERLLLRFALGDIAQDGDDLAAVLTADVADRLLQRPAAHLDPDELRRGAAVASALSRRTRNSTERLSPSAAASPSAVR